ncbi:MAG: alanine racemase [bacterium]|nr:alanine racemase [bacterium]
MEDPFSLRPSGLYIDLDAMRQNIAFLRSRTSGSRFMAVVKANAYGHGLLSSARVAIDAGADYLGVAFVEEGIRLRQAGIKAPILVFGGIFETQVRYFLEHNLELTVSSIDKLKSVEAVAKASGVRARIHLKIDTGMERVGVHYYSAGRFLDEAMKVRFCDVVGVFSHLALADEDEAFTRVQIGRFSEIRSYLAGRISGNTMFHLANSAGVLSFPDSHFDMVRPGLAIYGVSPAENLLGTDYLTPVLQLKSRVVYFKVVKKGAGVSYGHRWIAPADTRVVTIPVGYGDGLPRRLSPGGQVLIRERKYPIVGVVCMDQLMADIGPDGEAYVGDEVVLIGRQGAEAITVQDVARIDGTITYEVLTSLNQRLPRRYTGGSAVQLE